MKALTVIYNTQVVFFFLILIKIYDFLNDKMLRNYIIFIRDILPEMLENVPLQVRQ